jgi:hypothetical protein
MQEAGTWNGTTVLLSADHSWRGAPNFDGKKDLRVPFMLKFPGRNEGITFTAPFNTVLTHDLLLAIARGEVRTAPEASSWIRRYQALARPSRAVRRTPPTAF